MTRTAPEHVLLLAAAGDPPPALTPVAGRPFLDHGLANARRYGLTRVVLAVAGTNDVYLARYGDGRDFGLAIRHQAAPAGTDSGGLARLAAPSLESPFLVLAAERLFDCNYFDLALALRPDRLAALALRSGQEAGAPPRIGAAVLTGQALELAPPGDFSLERDLYPGLAARGALASKVYDGFFLDIGRTGDASTATAALTAWRRKPCVIFDRDGVLNEDLGFVHRPEDFRWCPDAVAAVKWCNDHGYLAMVATNQSGIARGYFDEAAFRRLTDWMQAELRRQGAHLDAVYYCPHHPEAGDGPYTRPCDCRKPAGGMLRRALTEWGADASRSLVIGDKASDLAAAAACGLAGHRYSGGSLLAFLQGLVPPLPGPR